MEDTNQELTVTLAMDNDSRRSAAIALLEEAGLPYSLTKIGMYITDKAVLAQSSVIILDTNDDAASIVHIVHEIYKLFPAEATLPIIGILSGHQLDLNPRFGYWLIDHHAAVAIMLDFDGPYYPKYLMNMIRLFATGRRKEEE
jgi:hypothetical protein